MSFFKKIQTWPESKKKIVLWSVVIIVGVPLFILWIKIAQGKLDVFHREGFKGIPKFEMPEITK